MHEKGETRLSNKSELQKQKTSENTITLEGSEFESNLAMLKNANAMKAIMENELMSHFKVKLKVEKLYE